MHLPTIISDIYNIVYSAFISDVCLFSKHKLANVKLSVQNFFCELKFSEETTKKEDIHVFMFNDVKYISNFNFSFSCYLFPCFSVWFWRLIRSPYCKDFVPPAWHRPTERPGVCVLQPEYCSNQIKDIWKIRLQIWDS